MSDQLSSASGMAAAAAAAASGAVSDPPPSRPQKRPLALSGITSTVEERNPDFLCPVCFDLIREPTLTRCGHSFCYVCIFKSIGSFQRCPKCNTSLTSASHIFPNRLLGELITKYEHRTLAHEHVGAVPAPDAMDSLSACGVLPAVSNNGLKNFIASESEKLGLTDVQAMLDILQQRKQTLEAKSAMAQNSLLHEFLRHLLRQKLEQAQHIRREIDLVQGDLQEVQAILGGGAPKTECNAASMSVADTSDVASGDGGYGETVPGTPPPPVAMTKEVVEMLDRMDSSPTPPPPPPMTPPPPSQTPPEVAPLAMPLQPAPAAASVTYDVAGNLLADTAGFNSFYTELPSANFQSRKRRLYAHFDDFVKSYFSVRSADLHLADGAGASTSAVVAEPPESFGRRRSVQPSTAAATRHGLDVFRENLVKFSRYNTLRTLATMYYSNDLQTSSTIVSSIVFDKDNEYFAIGGVTKRIKVFDYMAVVRDTIDIHYPSIEMTSTSKISCIAWNSYHKNVLATSDYEGILNIWDVNTGVRTNSLHEHEKRCWSVDFNEVDTRLIASGSDDARVKLWSTNDDRSIATLEAKANVCCVKFNPKSSCHLAFGSADHDVHYYDLRNMSKALCVFKGHKKAVSYVKFLNTEEIISASTDSQLKLWNVNRPPHCLRSFTGHVNEKNFVGLATDGDYVACGSEDNALYVYYKGLSKQLFNYRIDSGLSQKLAISVGPDGFIREREGGSVGLGGGLGGLGGGGIAGGGGGDVVQSRPSDAHEFLSAVCWRKGCNVVLAANSRGLIKVFELI